MFNQRILKPDSNWKLLTSAVALAGCLFSATTSAATASGWTVAIAGNNGNPALSTPTVTANHVGTFASGTITGPTANSASSHFTIADQPLPYLALYSQGSDGAGFNAAYGYATATYQYTFTVVGPSSTSALVDIAGLTYGEILASGNSNLFYNNDGVRISLTAPNIASTIADNGSSGTAAQAHAPFQGGADTVRIEWGGDSASPAPLNFNSHFNFIAPIATGTTVTVKLEGFAQGGLQGSISPTNISTTGSANVFVDPYFSIDPNWALTHSGYSIVMEPGVGNAPPSVPVPATAWLFATALGALSGIARKRLHK